MKIKELLDKREKWTKGSRARTKLGYPVLSRDASATCWCLYGAIFRCYESGEEIGNIAKLMDEKASDLGYDGFITFNDARDTTFEDIKVFVEELDV